MAGHTFTRVSTRSLANPLFPGFLEEVLGLQGGGGAEAPGPVPGGPALGGSERWEGGAWAVQVGGMEVEGNGGAWSVANQTELCFFFFLCWARPPFYALTLRPPISDFILRQPC